MKKIISIVLIVLTLCMIVPMFAVNASAASAFQTYTYSIEGKALYSPDAYAPENAWTSADMGLKVPLDEPRDLVTDVDGNVYIADPKNNRIVVLNAHYEYLTEIDSFVNTSGITDRLSAPEGVFASPTSLWVCDTKNGRLIEFDRSDYSFIRIINAPESQLLEKDLSYQPTAMAVDQYGRIYVVSTGFYQGIIVLDSEGNFVGFIGAQAVTISAWELLWRNFQTEEQKKLSDKTIPVTYNNVTITSDGFIYATIKLDGQGESSMQSAIAGKSKAGTYMPVKLLNPAGDEIMRRNGFWPPAGEIDIFTPNLDPDADKNLQGVSRIIDVAAGPEKTWSIIDAKRQKIYTYDFNGNLLFAFGDRGDMLGSIYSIKAIAYQGDKMLILDSELDAVIVYDRTEYGDMLIQAIAAENSLEYSYAIECWKKVLQRNANFDAAYIGIGNAYYRKADYAQALEYYEMAYDVENWSQSYKEVRKEWMETWLIPMVLAIVALLIAVVKFFGWAAKVNKRVATDGKARKTFGQELLYGFHVIFHPFDGFYDLKHEHRGSVRASLVFVGLTLLAFFYQGIGQGYVMNPMGNTTTIWMQAISVLIPLILFVTANWCLTTLFEGEGSFKDIFIATSYSLIPMILLIIPATIASNWVTTTEAAIITMITTIAFIWAGLLIFCGTMITHDYSIFKNLITIIGTIVAMAFIVFLVLLFSMLLMKLVSLVSNIVLELQYRL